MAKSVNRVKTALRAAGLNSEIIHMPASTRTAQEAAAACGCDPAQIVKSLVFQGTDSGALKLLLVSGRYQVDMVLAREAVGEPLERAEPARVRQETGFSIGGVAPLGHLNPIPIWIDNTLLSFANVWVAAGAPNAVFAVAPRALLAAIGATVAKLVRA